VDGCQHGQIVQETPPQKNSSQKRVRRVNRPYVQAPAPQKKNFIYIYIYIYIYIERERERDRIMQVLK
jgi:hypothetical protein